MTDPIMTQSSTCDATAAAPETAAYDDLLILLHETARMVHLRIDTQARRLGMTRAQWVLLSWLKRRPGLSQNELASLVEVEPISVARLVDRLEARGLVERRADPEDKRINRLHLTPGSAPLLKIIHSYRLQLNGIATRKLSQEDMEALRSGLSIIKRNVVEDRRETQKSG